MVEENLDKGEEKLRWLKKKRENSSMSDKGI